MRGKDKDVTILKVWRVVYSLCCKPKEQQVLLCLVLGGIAPFLFMSMTLTQEPRSELIPFSFTKKPLLSIMEELAKKKSLNLVLPTNPQDVGRLNEIMLDVIYIGIVVAFFAAFLLYARGCEKL